MNAGKLEDAFTRTHDRPRTLAAAERTDVDETAGEVLDGIRALLEGRTVPEAQPPKIASMRAATGAVEGDLGTARAEIAALPGGPGHGAAILEQPAGAHARGALLRTARAREGQPRQEGRGRVGDDGTPGAADTSCG